MKSELLTRALTQISTLLTGVVLVSCGGDAASPAAGAAAPGGKPPATPVRTTLSELKAETFYDTYPGTVVPLEEVEIRPQAGGYITEVHFKEGDRVKRGQRLFSIDVRAYETGVARADASVSTAEANLALAEKDVERYSRLNEAEAIAKQTLERAQAQVEVYRQQLASARAELRGAETQLDYTSITSPIDGSTGLATAKVGTQVSPGQPLLTTVSQLAPVGVDFALEQDGISAFSEFEGKSAKQLDSTFRIRLPGGEMYSEYGQVYALDRAVDPRTSNLTVRLQFANPKFQLRPGMNLDVEVLNANSGTVVMIPDAAIGEQMGEFYVYEVEDGMALRRTIRAGRKIRGRTVVLEGLEGGEPIVVEGVKALRDSARVSIAPPKASTGGAGSRPTARSTQAN